MYNSAYFKSLTLQGWDYFKIDGFIYRSIRKSEYIEGKKIEKEKRKEAKLIKKQLRNS